MLLQGVLALDVEVEVLLEDAEVTDLRLCLDGEVDMIEKEYSDYVTS